jgi:hypothetical protein
MSWLIIIVILLLTVGPLWRPLLSSWRTVLPVATGALVGWWASLLFLSYMYSGPVLLAGPVLGALMIGSAGRAWLYENFPPGGK